MKKTMFALAAMMVAGLASAVTTTWKNTEIGNAFSQSFTLDKSMSVAIAVSFTSAINDKTSDSTFATVLTGSDGAHLHVYKNTNGTNNGIGANLGAGGGGTWTDNATPVVENEVYSVVVTFDKQENGSFIYTVFVDGVQLSRGNTLSTGTYSAGDKNMTFAALADSTHVFKDAAIYDSVLSTEAMAWMATNNTAVLPEPTVLALLALGVAGVALKRKVA